jgi:hypothetical protein
METQILALVGYIFGGLAAVYAAAQAFDFFRKKKEEHRNRIVNNANAEREETDAITQLQKDVKDLKKEDITIHTKIDKIIAEQEVARQQFIIETHAWMYRMWFECKKRGYVTAMDLQTIEERYEFYKTRGGNSYVDDLVKQIRKMPQKDLF